MRLFLDLAPAILIAVTVIVCWHRGFIRSMLGVAKTLIAVIVTYLFGERVSAWLAEHVIGDRVTNYVHTRFLAMHEQGGEVFDLAHTIENLPNWLKVLIKHTDTSSAVGTDYAGMSEASGEQLYDMAQSFAAPITNVISDFLGYSAVFLVAMLLLTLLAFVLGKIADLPVIRTCDRLLGFLLGLVSAALYASVFAVLIFAVFSMIEGANEGFRFHEALEQTMLFKYVYEYNIFRFVFGIG
jgi:uncharacterized membrane protein required for colicin V production